jgi:hypothetical protein
MRHAALRGLAEMCNELDPFVFPELPDEAAAATVPCPQHPRRLRIHRSETTGNDRGADAAITIADGPSPIVKISPSN